MKKGHQFDGLIPERFRDPGEKTPILNHASCHIATPPMRSLLPLLALLAFIFPSCISVKTEHEIKPIEINVNVRVRVEKELDNFFADLDNEAANLSN